MDYQDGDAADVYREMLEAIGGRADEIGQRQIASHWPFVGSHYRGLVVVGQALMGWDADETPARWRSADARTAEGRERLLAGTQAWACGREEPMTEVLRWGHRARSPFWGLSKRLVPMLEPDTDSPWFARYAWWNVYPLGWDERDESPTGLLKEVQTPFVSRLFWSVLDDLDARRVVLVSGKDWWPEVQELLGLQTLTPRTTPIIAAGIHRGRTIVATYHPGAHLKGITRDAFAAAIAETIRALEG